MKVRLSAALSKHEDAVAGRPRSLAAARGVPSARDEAEHDGDRHRLLVRLARRRRRALREIEPVGLRRLVVMALHRDPRRAGLRVPAREMGEVAAGHVGEGVQEILDRGGGAVAALEVEVHAAPEILVADDRLEHADDLGALLVDGRGVEVVDLAILRRPHRMGEGARILRGTAARAGSSPRRCGAPGASARRRRIPGRGRPSGPPSGRAGTSRGR